MNVITVEKHIIDKLYKDKNVYFNLDCPENSYFILKTEYDENSSCLAFYRNNKLNILQNNYGKIGLSPKNAEQKCVLHALLDENIKCVILSGVAGSGKTLMSIAAAMYLSEEKKYKSIILTKPTYQVGNAFGILPGKIEEKYAPYLESYSDNFEFLLGDKIDMLTIINNYNLSFLPLQFMRGVSKRNSFIIADECQSLNLHEMQTLCTRLGEGSKLILIGDLQQIDNRLAAHDTGLYKIINSTIAQKSCLISNIKLVKNERSELSQLFTDIFNS